MVQQATFQGRQTCLPAIDVEGARARRLPGASMRGARPGAFEAEAARSRSLLELNVAFRARARQLGFTAYAVGYVPSRAETSDPFLLLDWPRAWLELYAREGFASEDAVVARGSVSPEPFTWAELQAEQPGASARVFAAARRFGWTDGLLVPIRAKRAPGAVRIGVVSLAAADPLGSDALRRAEAVQASVFAFHRAVVLARTQEPATLTDREREAIALVASGHGDREIGNRLGISTATAHFHVEQAKRKLGVATRARAVAVAVAEGIVR